MIQAKQPKKQGIHIEHWLSGLVTNRAAISTPYKYSFGTPIRYYDALIDGSNVEISPANTLQRRPGWSRYCSVTYGADVPQNFFGCRLNGTIYDFLATNIGVYQFDATHLNLIYTKGTTAQSYFAKVGNVLYFSDGNANKRWDGTINSQNNYNVQNNGIAAPTVAPTVTNLNLFDSVGAVQYAHAWSPSAVYSNTTASPQNYYLQAPTSEIYWAVVPAGTSLSSQSSAPNWASQFGVTGGLVQDGQMKWINCGTIGTWKASTGSPTYFNSAFTTSAILQSGPKNGTLTTTGSTSANWVVTSNVAAFVVAGSFSGVTNTLQARGLGFAIPSGATVQGIKATIGKSTTWPASMSDNLVKLVKAGVEVGTSKAVAGTWPKSTQAVVYGSNTDLWGTTWAAADINSATFGLDLIANVTYTNGLSAKVSYIQITVFYTVSSGDVTGTYTSSVILDSNGNLQRVSTLGTTGTSQPAWATTIGATTTDNAGGGTMVWTMIGTGAQIASLFSWTYAYGFRTTSAHLSTMSPLLVVQAPIIGLNLGVTMNYSADTACSELELYRTADGGSLLLYDTTVQNNTAGTTTTYFDRALDTDLNFLLVGPVAHANDPPPGSTGSLQTTGATLIAYHLGRVWMAVGNLLYFSAGPDCTNGDGNQAYPPANVFTLDAPITGFAPVSQGLVVFTADSMSIVLGGPQTLTFWVQPLLKNLGIETQNCLDFDGQDLLIYTAQKQLMAVSIQGREELGKNIAFTLANQFGPGASYVAMHRSGQDQGIFMSDGSTTTARYNINAASWDALGTPTGGIGPLASLDVAVGTRYLLSTSNGFIVKRDTTTFSDNGTAYAAFATVGSIVLSEAGEEAIAHIKSFALQEAAVGTATTISVLPNEISGSFTSIPQQAADPWPLLATTTIRQNRYDWLGVQSTLPNAIRHLQIKLTFSATDTVKNEVFTLAIV